MIDDFDGMPLPTAPIVPLVECVHDRIAIEIMRGCPWQCRFCQSTVIKRPLRIRRGRNDRRGGVGKLSPHRLRRDFAALAVDERLSLLRAAGRADARDVSPAGREHFGPQPAGERTTQERGGLGRPAPSQQPDLGAGSRPRRHARTDPQEDQERRPVRRLPAGVSATASSRSSSISCAACRASGAVDLDGILEMSKRWPGSASRSGAGRPRSRPACRTSFPRPTRRINGTACRRAIISAGPSNICASARRSAAWWSNATTSKPACWKACSAAATGG